MNQHFWVLTLSITGLLILPGCVDRAAADRELARGCQAGAQAMLPEGHTIKSVTASEFETSKTLGDSFREARLTVQDFDGWHEEEKNISCIFVEDFAFAGLGYTVDLYQLNMGDQVYGKEGDEILGSMEDHLKLMNAVAEAMKK